MHTHSFQTRLNYLPNWYLLVTMTGRDGKIFRLENVFLRGGQIKFIVLPELLKNAPILKKIQGMKAKKLEGEKAGGGKSGGLGPNAKKPRKA